MLNLIVANTDPSCSKPKICNRFSKPNFRISAERDFHTSVCDLLGLGCHLVRAGHYRGLRVSAFSEWSRAVA